jgi:hypothetical protein
MQVKLSIICKHLTLGSQTLHHCVHLQQLIAIGSKIFAQEETCYMCMHMCNATCYIINTDFTNLNYSYDQTVLRYTKVDVTNVIQPIRYCTR